MRNQLKKIYSKVMKIPLIGYLLQIILAIVKLPLVRSRIDVKYAEIDGRLVAIENKLSQLSTKFDSHEAKLNKIDIDLPSFLNMLNSSTGTLRLFKREMIDLQKKFDDVSNLRI